MKGRCLWEGIEDHEVGDHETRAREPASIIITWTQPIELLRTLGIINSYSKPKLLTMCEERT